MSTLTRRQLLARSFLGAGVAAAGGGGLWWAMSDRFGGKHTLGEALTQPEELASRNGFLELALTAAPKRLRVGGREASVQTFNGSLPGPTLRVAPGDTIRIAMTNDLPSPTNLHVHGLHVSPRGNSDNPFLSIAPGDSFDYEILLPKDHPPGTYWYHPHRHGTVADQVAAGLYGAIIVEDPAPLPVTRERLMVISDLSLDASGSVATVDRMQRMMGREGETVLVNGQVRPHIAAAPGERERWRIVNACPSRYLRIRLDGQDVQLFSHDFGRLTRAGTISELLLLPGGRAELLVDTQEGSSTLTAEPVDRGSMGAMMGGGSTGGGDTVELLTLEVAGESVDTPGPVPAGTAMRDLRGDPIAGRRSLDFGMGMGAMMGGGMSFTIDGRAFDGDRNDATVEAGTVEEWTLTNSSTMDHPVHLHVWPMQVVEDGQGRVTEPTWRDVVNVPASGQVKVLIAFEDFTGRTVYHCHILDHEDEGMMGTVQVG